MTRLFHWLLSVLLGAAFVHLVALAALPYLVMSRLIVERSRNPGENVFFHPELATADWRYRVRPSPDLAYSTAVYNVSERPLHVVVPVTEPYTSLAGIALNTDNFFVITDRDVHGSAIDLVLVGPDTPREGLEGLRVVEAPTNRGVLLVRRVVPNPTALASIEGARHETRVEIR